MAELTDEVARKDALLYKAIEDWSKDPWRAGLLVARSCVVGKATDKQNLMQIQTRGKLTPEAFAEISGVSHDTISRYQRRWGLAVSKGLVLNALILKPGQEVEFDPNVHTIECWIELGKALSQKAHPAPSGGIWLSYGVPTEELRKALDGLETAFDYDKELAIVALLEALNALKEKLDAEVTEFEKRTEHIRK
jgi:hypothetical protein